LRKTLLNHSFLEGIGRVVGPEDLCTSDLKNYTVDGILPKAVVFPEDVKELSSMLFMADEERLSVVPRGSGTKMGLGSVPERVDLVVSLDRLNQVVEYEPADLTITVKAGIRLADLQMVLGERGQFLPLDPPFGGKATTIGGIIATNSSGPLRCRYGTIRDMLIGLRAVKPDGGIIKGGGKVVKNVAGYDLNKLFIGSLGTLGVVAEASLKLQPLPETKRELVAFFPSLQAASQASSVVLESQFELTIFEFFNRSASRHAFEVTGLETDGYPYGLFVGVDGPSGAVSWQLRKLSGILSVNGAASIMVLDEGKGKGCRERVRNLTPTMLSLPGSASCKVSVLISETFRVFQVSEETGNRHSLVTSVVGRLANGIVYVYFFPERTTDATSIDRLVGAISELRGLVSELGGHLVVECAPPEVKKRAGVWGESGDDIVIMRGIKKAMDPHSILNPGRFLGGI